MKISELIQDDRNLNLGTERGRELLEHSVQEYGAGRSILIDRNGRIIAGNKTVLAAIKEGIDEVEVVESTGKEIIAVKRTDVDINTKKGRGLAMADNAVAAANLRWDYSLLSDMKAEGLEIERFGLEDVFGIEDDSDLKGGEAKEDRERIIIVYKDEDAEKVKKLLGVEDIKRTSYTLEEIRKNHENEGTEER